MINGCGYTDIVRIDLSTGKIIGTPPAWHKVDLTTGKTIGNQPAAQWVDITSGHVVLVVRNVKKRVEIIKMVRKDGTK